MLQVTQVLQLIITNSVINAHIITNSVINAEFKTVIIKIDISYHFSIFFIFNYVINSTEASEEFIYKRNYSSNSIETFKYKLRQVNWNDVKQSNNANKSYAKFTRYLLLCMKNISLSSKLG